MLHVYLVRDSTNCSTDSSTGVVLIQQQVAPMERRLGERMACSRQVPSIPEQGATAVSKHSQELDFILVSRSIVYV